MSHIQYISLMVQIGRKGFSLSSVQPTNDLEPKQTDSNMAGKLESHGWPATLDTYTYIFSIIIKT